MVRIQSIVSNAPPRIETAYMKVGDSQSWLPAFMTAFGNPGLGYNLGTHTELEATVQWFLASHVPIGPANESTTRTQWVLGKETLLRVPATIVPSPLQQAIAENPRYAVIMYGTNPDDTLELYEANMRQIVAECVAAGVIPILTTVPYRPVINLPPSPGEGAVSNAIVRRVAEDNSIPLVDLRRETDLLPSRGISGDQLHLSVAGTGPGDLTPAGLQGGHNTRNFLTLQALARTKLAREGIASP